MVWLHPKILFQFLRFTASSFMDYRGLENAKSLTFTSLFAVIPLMTLTVIILSAFPSLQIFGGQVEEMIFDRLLPSSSNELQSYLANFAVQAKNLTLIGLIMLIVTSYLMLTNIERSFNLIWGVSEQRKGLASFLLYWSVLSLGPMLLGIGFAISSYITTLEFFDSITEVSDFVGVSNIALNFFPTVLTAFAFTLVYVAVPNCGVKLIHGFIGGLVVALFFILVKLIFTRFIASASYEFVYGTFAAIPIFLLWIYVCWVVILMGANLVRSIPLFSAQQVSGGVNPVILMLALLHKFWEKHQTGESLRIKELIDENWPFQEIPIATFLNILKQQNFIRSCNQEEYLLTKDLHSVSLWNLLRILPWPLPSPDEINRASP